MATLEELRQEFLAGVRAKFKYNALLLINEMLIASLTQEKTELVDEMLHSIFFLGEINIAQISPGEIFANDDDLLDYTREVFPQPFTLYTSRLPRRSPFSCVLDMVVHLEGQENEEAIREILRKLVNKLKRNTGKPMLSSSTICISAGSSTDSVRHYGVSMSTTRRPASQILDPDESENLIMIAASCLNFWEEHVADAVMSYYPVENRMRDFDVTIIIPEGVRCEAFNLINKKPKSPCQLCKEMFGFRQDADTKEPNWNYGNCAEAESLSNLLREEEVRVQRNENWSEEYQERVRDDVRNQLRRYLEWVDFAWDNQFYTAQRAAA